MAKSLVERLKTGERISVEAAPGVHHGIYVTEESVYVEGCDCTEEATPQAIKQMYDLLGAWIRVNKNA